MKQEDKEALKEFGVFMVGSAVLVLISVGLLYLYVEVILKP